MKGVFICGAIEKRNDFLKNGFDWSVNFAHVVRWTTKIGLGISYKRICRVFYC